MGLFDIVWESVSEHHRSQGQSDAANGRLPMDFTNKSYMEGFREGQHTYEKSRFGETYANVARAERQFFTGNSSSSSSGGSYGSGGSSSESGEIGGAVAGLVAMLLLGVSLLGLGNFINPNSYNNFSNHSQPAASQQTQLVQPSQKTPITLKNNRNNLQSRSERNFYSQPREFYAEERVELDIYREPALEEADEPKKEIVNPPQLQTYSSRSYFKQKSYEETPQDKRLREIREYKEAALEDARRARRDRNYELERFYLNSYRHAEENIR